LTKRELKSILDAIKHVDLDIKIPDKFEESKIDRASGEKVLFSWWINDEVLVLTNNVDLFDEKDRIVIVADLPGLRLPNHPDASANYKNGILEVVIKKEGGYEG